MEIDQDAYIVIPDNVDFSEVTSSLTYDDLKEDEIARINYSFHDINVGSASLVPVRDTTVTFDFGTQPQIVEPPTEEENTIYINVKNIIIGILSFAILLIVIFMVRSMFINTRKSRKTKKA